jgi:hypothetical protein
MGARNQVGIGLSYRPASLCSLATQYQTRRLELIPRPTAGLKFSALVIVIGDNFSTGELICEGVEPELPVSSEGGRKTTWLQLIRPHVFGTENSSGASPH